MNIYHITYVPMIKSVHLYFWGCNLSCRACVRLKETYDYHLRDSSSNGAENIQQAPERFLELEEIISILRKLDINQVVFMGAELLSISEMGHFLNRTLWHNQAALTSSLRPWL